MRVALAVIVVGLLIGCNRDSDLDDPNSTSTTTETHTTTTSDGVATTYGGQSACMATNDCEAGTYCAAAYDPGTATRGPAECVSTCVPRDDLTRWCIDDLACCDGLRCNSVDGFCHPAADETTSGDAGMDGDSSTTDDSTTGTDTGSDTTKGEADSTSSGGSDSTSSGGSDSTSSGGSD